MSTAESELRTSLATNELKDAVFSLEVANELLDKVRVEDQYSKWFIVTLHNALQGFMVVALRGSNSWPVMSDRNRYHKKIKEEFAAFLRNPEGHNETLASPILSDFKELYEKIQNAKLMERLCGSRKFEPTSNHDYSVRLLHELRNELIHFFPKFNVVDLIGLPSMVHNCTEVIRFLSFDSGNVLWFEAELEPKTRTSIAQIQDKAADLDAEYRQA